MDSSIHSYYTGHVKMITYYTATVKFSTLERQC